MPGRVGASRVARTPPRTGRGCAQRPACPAVGANAEAHGCESGRDRSHLQDGQQAAEEHRVNCHLGGRSRPLGVRLNPPAYCLRRVESGRRRLGASWAGQLAVALLTWLNWQLHDIPYLLFPPCRTQLLPQSAQGEASSKQKYLQAETAGLAQGGGSLVAVSGGSRWQQRRHPACCVYR